MYASVDLEGVGSDGVDGPPQALDGSVVAGGVGAMDTLADMAAAVVDMAACVLAPAGAAPAAAAGAAGAAALGAPAVGAQGAAPVAERAGVTEQRIRQAVPGLPVGNLTVAVLKPRLQMHGMEAQGLHVLREMRCGNSGSSTALSSSACPAARTRRGLAHHKVLIAQPPCRVEAPLITGLVHEPAPRIEQLVPLDCALVEDVLIGRLVPGLVVLHEHRPAAGLYLDRWQLWIVPGEMARAEAQASRAAAGVIDTLTTVLDALWASAVAVIEKDTLFHCVAEQIVERLPEGRRHFGHLCKGPQRVVCGDGSCLGTCRM